VLKLTLAFSPNHRLGVLEFSYRLQLRSLPALHYTICSVLLFPQLARREGRSENNTRPEDSSIPATVHTLLSESPLGLACLLAPSEYCRACPVSLRPVLLSTGHQDSASGVVGLPLACNNLSHHPPRSSRSCNHHEEESSVVSRKWMTSPPRFFLSFSWIAAAVPLFRLCGWDRLDMHTRIRCNYVRG